MRPEERQISEAHRNCSKTVRRQYKEIVLNLPENARISLKFDPKFSNLKPEKWVQSCPNFRPVNGAKFRNSFSHGLFP